ncbi:MAG TPA: sulfite exporter TauE/SafE family protein [Alphaproteobacteria bacterium]|nr:sulfite exporter TauE/SafE family protein [Alphaproteobacteria bacterium]
MSAFFESLSLWQMLAGLAMLCASGMLRGFTGYGFAIAAVPLLSLIMPPTSAVPIVLILQLFIGNNNLKETVRLADWRAIKILVAAAAVVTPLGLLLLTRLPQDIARLCIAAIVVGTVIMLASKHRHANGAPRTWVTLCYGALSGLTNGLGGMPGPSIIAYFLASDTPKERARASMIMVFTLTSVCALIPLLIADAVRLEMAVLALVALPLVWLSTSLGRRLFLITTDAIYRRAGLVILSATALMLVLRVIYV